MEYTEITSVLGYAKHEDYVSCWVFGQTLDGTYVASNFYPSHMEYHNEKLLTSQEEISRLITWFEAKDWQYAPLLEVQNDYWRTLAHGEPYRFSVNGCSNWNRLFDLIPEYLIPAKPVHMYLPKLPPFWKGKLHAPEQIIPLPPHWNGKEYPPQQLIPMPPHWNGKNHAPFHTCESPKFWILTYVKRSHEMVLHKGNKAGLLTDLRRTTPGRTQVVFPIHEKYLNKPSIMDELLKKEGWSLVDKGKYPLFTEDGRSTLKPTPSIQSDWRQVMYRLIGSCFFTETTKSKSIEVVKITSLAKATQRPTQRPTHRSKREPTIIQIIK